MPDDTSSPQSTCDWCGRDAIGWRVIDPGSVREVVRNGRVLDKSIQLDIRAYYCRLHSHVVEGLPPDKLLKKRRGIPEEQMGMFPDTHPERRRGTAILDS